MVFFGREKVLEAKQRSADRTFTMVFKSLAGSINVKDMSMQGARPDLDLQHVTRKT